MAGGRVGRRRGNAVFGGVRVEGLDEFRRALRAGGPAITKRLAEAHQQVARIVSDEAETKRARMAGTYGSYRRVRLRPAARQKAAIVTVGPARFAGAAEFGIDMHPVFGRWIAQEKLDRRVWPPWSGNQFVVTTGSVGYMVMPTVREQLKTIEDSYLDHVLNALVPAFPEGG